MKETFVYDGTEVVKTGREAIKEIKPIGSRAARSVTLVEITPLDSTFEWKKWIDPAQLFVIRPSDK